MRKYVLLTFLFLTTLFLFGAEKVDAKTCTGYKPAPYMYEVSPEVKVIPESLQTADNVCKGSNTEVWFSAFRSLPASYPYQDGAIHVRLWEDDPDGNEDEQVKYYIGTFYNKVVTEFWLNDTFITGNIDSVGDQTCELYLEFVISGRCCNYPVRATLFDYNICMN